MDALIRAQLAYEAGEVEEALALAHEILGTYPGSGAAEPARWLGARAAFSVGRYMLSEEMAGDYAAGQPATSRLAAEARQLVELARDAQSSPAREPALLGVVLPRSGSRILVQYADWVLEGVELAVRQYEERHGRDVELVVADDAGGVRTREAVMELERRGVLAILGPLLPQQLAEAAGARGTSDLLLVSPTIPEMPAAWPGVFSVNRGDTRGAQQLGRYAADVGLRQAAVLYPRSPEFERKARAFAVEYEAMGGQVRITVPYDSGTTTFAAHMGRILRAVTPEDTTAVVSDSLADDSLSRDPAAAGIATPAPLPSGLAADSVGAAATDPWHGRPPQQPFALFVPAPERDVQQIAPQVAFYGLDSAGVQIFGDEGWTTAAVRRVVPRQDFEGVIAASHFPPERSDAMADPEFVRAYEQMYRRSLENPLPALGFDATTVLLQSLPSRMLTPQALALRFRFLAGIRGATGVLSVRADQLVRTPFLVVIRRGTLAPAPHPWEYTLPVPKPPLPTDTASSGGVGR